jgi:MerR family transcriptional regulator, redox-sensitive transcriptional activator SoxR
MRESHDKPSRFSGQYAILAKSELPSFSKQLTINEVSRRSGVASSALRFYETGGLIRSERAGSGHRRYSRAVLRRIAFIVFAQRIGLTLNEVAAELAKLPADRVPERADWWTLSSTWSSRIDERIAELQRRKTGLTGCLGCGSLSLEGAGWPIQEIVPREMGWPNLLD